LTIYVLGAGVVGQATGIAFQHLGHRVVFVDVDHDTLDHLRNAGHDAVPPEEFVVRADDAVLVCVPTPATSDGIDYGYLLHACDSIAASMRHGGGGCLVVFRSTMPPGTTRRVLVPRLEVASGLRAGDEFDVCYNPEYLRAESALDDFRSASIVTLGGAFVGDRSCARARAIYAGCHGELFVTSYETAEFQKYVHNLFNATKISFFNEMRRAAASIRIEDIDEAFAVTAITAQGLWDPRYGTRDRGPYDGACLPKDVQAWLTFARAHDLPCDLVQATATVNASVAVVGP
jgi:UDPglucose 6-dehydrogenase